MENVDFNLKNSDKKRKKKKKNFFKGRGIKGGGGEGQSKLRSNDMIL